MTLEESVDRILERGKAFTDRFYELFFERHPEARAYFDGIDMQAQAVMLTMTFAAIRQHPHLSIASQQYLQVLGTKHNRKDVPRDVYPWFLETLLATLQEFHGDDWTDELGRRWSAAFEDTTALMFEGYERHFHT